MCSCYHSGQTKLISINFRVRVGLCACGPVGHGFLSEWPFIIVSTVRGTWGDSQAVVRQVFFFLCTNHRVVVVVEVPYTSRGSVLVLHSTGCIVHHYIVLRVAHFVVYCTCQTCVCMLLLMLFGGGWVRWWACLLPHPGLHAVMRWVGLFTVPVLAGRLGVVQAVQAPDTQTQTHRYLPALNPISPSLCGPLWELAWICGLAAWSSWTRGEAGSSM